MSLLTPQSLQLSQVRLQAHVFVCQPEMRFALCFALAIATKAFQLGAAPRLIARRRGALLVLQEPAPDAAKASLGMVSDYALNWIGKHADTPSQTHELVASPSGDHVWVSSSLDC